MEAERWRLIQEVFATVLEMSPEEREAWLERQARDDAELAEEIRGLVEAHEGAGTWLEKGALAVDSELQERWQTAASGLLIGPYRVLSELGRGGMGAVYLAVRDDGAFEQKVALKLIKRGMDTEEIVRRFLHERQILAGLAHPNIARLLDGGTTEDGRPFFVMEYVEGRPITEVVGNLRLDLRLRLFLKICSAVQHAHQNLVVHRDLKPANILVDQDGEPKLLDFGIAKLLEPGAFGGPTALTSLQQRPMTPEYASPEQRQGGAVTTATDVYCLGILLYELLVGASPQALQRRLETQTEVLLPSQAARVLAESKSEGRRLARRLHGDLDTIVTKALEDAVPDRYGTVSAFAEDVERYLDRRPVVARRPTIAYRWSRTVLRHKLASALLASVALLLGAAAYQAVELSYQRGRVEAQRHRAETLAEFLKNLFSFADPERTRGASMTAREILDLGVRQLIPEGDPSTGSAPKLRGGLEVEPETQAVLLKEIADVYSSLGLYPEAERLVKRAHKLRCLGDGSRIAAKSATADPACAEILTDLGEVALRQSDYPASRRFFERALALKKGQRGSREISIVDDLNGLGLVAMDNGDLVRASPYFKEALAMSRQATPQDPERLAESLRNLGNLASEEGSVEEAMPFFEEALVILESALGDDHPLTVRVRGDLVASLYQEGDHARAEALFREVLESRRRLLGSDHPEIALTLSNLAVVQQARGNLAEAEAGLRESLAIRRRLELVPDQMEAMTLNSLGAVLRKKGDLAAAQEVYNEAYELFQRLGGDRHPQLANVLGGLARVERRRGDPARAELLARQSLALYQEIYGADHPSVAASWQLLAEILYEKRDLAAAEEAFGQSLALRRQVLGPGHPDLAGALIGLGGVLVEGGRAREAEAYLLEGLAIQQEHRPPDDPRVALAQERLGSCYLLLGRPDQAGPLFQKSLETLTTLHGPHDPRTRRIAERLAGLKFSSPH